MNLFAITENNNEETVFRIPVTQGVQTEINNQFTQLSLNFFADKDLIPFDGNYKTEPDELFEINNFALNDDIIDSVSNSINYDVLNLERLEGRIKAIYATSGTARNPQIYFQVFDTRKIIADRGIPLYHRGGTFRKYENKGIVILNNLAVVYRNNNIYFNSYYNARRIVELSDYYLEATNEDVEEFTNGAIFEFEDALSFSEDLNSAQRKKIKSIQQRNIFQNLTIADIQAKANELGINFNYANGQVVVPTDKTYVKQLIKFLDEDYFITPLTQRPCVTNSKREINI